jgi:hypothetical protein
MPYTQSDADKLRAAIVDGRGARSMTFDNQTVVFNSLDEMQKQLARMESEIATANGTRRSFRVATTSKGVGLSGGWPFGWRR